MPQLTEATRAWIYRIMFAAFAVATIYGLIDEGKIETWLLLAGAVLGTGTNGLASLYTSTKRPEQPEALDGDLDRGDIGLMEIVLVLLAICLVVWLVRVL